MNRLFKYSGYFVLFVASFMVFLFLTFPYEVLKETISTNVSKMIGAELRIGALSPRLPLGMKAENVRIKLKTGESSINVSELEAGAALLPLLWGTARAYASLSNLGGSFDLNIDLPIFKMISGIIFPSAVTVAADNYPIDDLSDFALTLSSQGRNVNPLVSQVLSQLGFGGRLGADIDLEIDTTNVAKSTGNARITLKSAFLKLQDSLGLPDQAFSRAEISGNIDKGQFKFDPKSGLTSDGFGFDLAGFIKLKPDVMKSDLNLSIVLSLKEQLKEILGILIDGGTGTGKMKLSVKGSLLYPRTEKT
jgi:type II secretion system protein N